jgi:hypothetical protein
MSRVNHLQTNSVQFYVDAHHGSVDAVMTDRNLSGGEKRAILSAWASDMYAVESSPEMRMIPGHAEPVRLRDILHALRSLDHDDPPPGGAVSMKPPRPAIIEARAGRADSPPRRPIKYCTGHRGDSAELRAASMRARRGNIRRYNRLLETELTDLERDFIRRRIAEEKDALRRLAASKD